MLIRDAQSSTKVPFWNLRSAAVTGAALVCLCLEAYVVCRHWQMTGGYFFAIIALPMSMQFISQWWRGLSCLRQANENGQVRSELSGLLLQSYATYAIILIGLDAILRHL